MEFYLIKYRVTTANIMATYIETYSTIEDAEAKYYEAIADAMTNNKLKYVMVSIVDSAGSNIMNIGITCPGEISVPMKYCLLECTIKTDGSSEEEVFSYDSLTSAINKKNEDTLAASSDNTIKYLRFTILDPDGNVENTDMVTGGGYVNYRDKYLLITNKTNIDGSHITSINKYNDVDSTMIVVYGLFADSIDDTSLLYVECRVEDTDGNTVFYDKKKCKGEIPEPTPEPEPDENEIIEEG